MKAVPEEGDVVWYLPNLFVDFLAMELLFKLAIAKSMTEEKGSFCS